MQDTLERKQTRTAEDFLRENIMNLPIGFDLSPSWLVARVCDGKLWYYGSYPNESRADGVARDIGNGVVLCIPQ